MHRLAQPATDAEKSATSAVKLERVTYLVERLDIPESTAFRWIADGLVPGVKRIGRTIRLDRDDVEQWIKGGCKSPSA